MNRRFRKVNKQQKQFGVVHVYRFVRQRMHNDNDGCIVLCFLLITAQTLVSCTATTSLCHAGTYTYSLRFVFLCTTRRLHSTVRLKAYSLTPGRGLMMVVLRTNDVGLADLAIYHANLARSSAANRVGMINDVVQQIPRVHGAEVELPGASIPMS